MQIDQCHFVCGSDLFNDHREVWNEFSESDPDCSWGNNNRSLVTRDFLLTALEAITAEGIEVIRDRLASLPIEVYVDLEN